MNDIVLRLDSAVAERVASLLTDHIANIASGDVVYGAREDQVEAIEMYESVLDQINEQLIAGEER